MQFAILLRFLIAYNLLARHHICMSINIGTQFVVGFFVDASRSQTRTSLAVCVEMIAMHFESIAFGDELRENVSFVGKPQKDAHSECIC